MIKLTTENQKKFYENVSDITEEMAKKESGNPDFLSYLEKIKKLSAIGLAAMFEAVEKDGSNSVQELLAAGTTIGAYTHAATMGLMGSMVQAGQAEELIEAITKAAKSSGLT